MKRELLDDGRRALTLLAGWVFSYHLAVLLHELGHAVGYLAAGGRVTAIWMEAPLPAGHVAGTSANPYPHVWGGVVFGALMAPVLLLVARYLERTPVIKFAAVLTAAFCLGHNGMYLLVGSLIPFADATQMVSLGAPRWFLFLLGAPLLCGFVLVLARALPGIDLPADASTTRWVIVTECGLIAFPAFMLGAMQFMPVPADARASTTSFVACYAVCYAVAAVRARSPRPPARSAGTVPSDQPIRQWKAAAQLAGMALLLIGLEMGFLRHP